MGLKIFWKLGLTYLVLLLLVLASIYLYTERVLHDNFIQAGYDHLESLANLAEGYPPGFQEGLELISWASWMAKSGARVTVIAADGRVLVDSDEDASVMENHADRPEIGQALAEGTGRATRYSHTLRRNLVYFATRRVTEDGETIVLRLALPLARINEAISAVRGRMATASLIVMLLGVFLSLIFTRSFSSRVERLKEFSRRVADGDFRPLPVPHRGDELVELAKALNDTAARLDTTIRKVEEQRNQSAAILGSMEEGVVLVDRQERVVFCNQAFRRILHVDVDVADCRGRPLVEVIRHADLLGIVQAALSSGKVLQGEIAVGTTPTRDFLVKAAPVEAGGAYGALLVLLDITEIHRLERVRRDFVANLSHELKTPLTAIRGFAETLLAGALEDARHSEKFLRIIQEHAVRLGRLTDDLLKLSRIEAGKMELDLRPIDIRELIRSSVETARFKAEAKELRMEHASLGELPPIVGDEQALREVLQNLLDNAVQYTQPGGSITVSVSESDGRVRIDVSDTGIGIPLEHRDRIFERFYRVDPARSRQVGGTGLGLAIARHLMEAQGGTISVRSTVGSGSTFSIHLPAAGPSSV